GIQTQNFAGQETTERSVIGGCLQLSCTSAIATVTRLSLLRYWTSHPSPRFSGRCRNGKSEATINEIRPVAFNSRGFSVAR
ncbi:MAG TPA: hypothetical protein VN825_10080, partial [Candidatus Acidoferrum sp.]|nr:hypothetical protein [Candidatus Acidoferrum sp.]